MKRLWKKVVKWFKSLWSRTRKGPPKGPPRAVKQVRVEISNA